MNLSAFDVYLVYQLDTISTVFTIASFLFGMVSIISVLAHFDDDVKLPRKWMVSALVTHFLIILGATLCPGTDTMLKMIVVPELVNSRIVQTDMPELYNLAVESLKKSLNPNAK